MTRPTLYEAAGGAEGMLRLAHAWHARALADPVVEHAFSHGFLPDHSERLAAYLGEALGGPPSYSTTMSSETEVIRLHSGNGTHDEMDRHAIETFAQALDDIELTDPRLRRAILDYWTDGVRRMGEHPDTPDTVPHDLVVRRWSWDGPVG